MGFTRGESPPQSRMAKAGRKILQNLKNQFRPKKKNKIEVHMQRGNYQKATDYGMYKAGVYAVFSVELVMFVNRFHGIFLF